MPANDPRTAAAPQAVRSHGAHARKHAELYHQPGAHAADPAGFNGVTAGNRRRFHRHRAI